jgi:hypothetical protein
MAAIITNKFRIHNASQFKEGFSEAAPTQMYLFIGRPQPWTSDASPDTPVDTVESEYYNYDDMIAMKRIQSSDVSHAILRRDWTSGKYYDIYRHNYDGSAAQGVDIDAGTTTTRASLFDANFFVITDEYNVYKCIDNRNAANTVAASTTKPTGTSTTAFTTADGYTWKYMYSISAADVLKFVSTDFIPVKTLGANPGSTDSYYNQYLVEAAAVSGGISNIIVTNGGSGYTSAPTVTITGDGTGATATATVTSNAVTAINITAAGTGYSYVVVTLSGGAGTSAAASAIVSPRGGHGADAIEELGGFYVIMNVRLEYADGSGDFPVDNDYRRIGIVKDPLLFGTTTLATTSTLKATPALIFNSGVTGTFSVDEVITQATTGATGRVVSWDATSRTLRYIKQQGVQNNIAFQATYNVTGAGSSAVGTVATSGGLANPEVAIDSGDIIYFENRRPINRASDQLEDIKIVVEM